MDHHAVHEQALEPLVVHAMPITCATSGVAHREEGHHASEGAEWKQIFQIIDAAYADYLTGMAALRKRVVDDVSRKLNDDGAVPDHPRRGARSRLAPARRRR